MVLYINHGDNDMKMMIQEVFSTYLVDGMFCYGMCQDLRVTICFVMVWLWYVPPGAGQPGEWLLRCPPWVSPTWGRRVAML